MVLFSSKTKQAVADQQKLNEATANGAADQIVKYKQLQAQWNALGNDLKAKKKFITENKDEFHNLGIEISNTSDAENVFKGNSQSVIDALMLRAKAAASAQIAVEKYKEAMLADQKVDDFSKEWDNAGFFKKVGLGIKAVFKAEFPELNDRLNRLIELKTSDKDKTLKERFDLKTLEDMMKIEL